MITITSLHRAVIPFRKRATVCIVPIVTLALHYITLVPLLGPKHRRLGIIHSILKMSAMLQCRCLDVAFSIGQSVCCFEEITLEAVIVAFTFVRVVAYQGNRRRSSVTGSMVRSVPKLL